MQRWAVAFLVLITTVYCAGCLGKLDHDQGAKQIVEAARTELDLPLQGSHPYWLLRSQPGWVGSHEVEFGGGPTDSGYAAIRAARFADVDTAAHAYARLTPDYIYLLYRKRMNSIAYPFVYPVPLPGEATAVMLYEVRLPPEVKPDVKVIGQMTTILAGTSVLVIESIGVHPEQLVPTITQLTSVAYRVSGETQ